MFTSARLKLTAWYLVIIMMVSGIFSLAIYSRINQEYIHIEEAQKILSQKIEREFNLPVREFIVKGQVRGAPVPAQMLLLDPGAVTEARKRLQLTLLLINLGILGISGVAGYFLAGRTLRPIKKMVDEQNRFITDASHELRTPLTSLKSEIEVNLREKKLTLPEAKKLLISNLEEVNKLQYLSDNLIKLTQFQKSYDRTIFNHVSLLNVSNEAIRKVSNLARTKKIEIRNQIKEYKIEGEKQSLIELFVILLDNAIKYGNKGGFVGLRSKKTDGMIEIKVEDNGVGIEKKDIPHLFDRFYRADQSRSGSDGYGLGLAIAKQIVDKHKGTIKVSSEASKGTTFSVQLPIR